MNGGPRYRAGFDASTVEMLATSLGSRFYDMARKLLGYELVEHYPGDPMDTIPTPDNRLRQFIYLYERFHMPGSPGDMLSE